MNFRFKDKTSIKDLTDEELLQFRESLNQTNITRESEIGIAHIENEVAKEILKREVEKQIKEKYVSDLKKCIKQTNIDVFECDQLINGHICNSYWTKDGDEETLLCKSYPNCYYRQLKRKEKECEELKQEIAALEDSIYYMQENN